MILNNDLCDEGLWTKKMMVEFCLKYFLKIGVKAPLLKKDSDEKKYVLYFCQQVAQNLILTKADY